VGAVKTKPNRSASASQLALKAKHKLTDKQFREMLEMLAHLTLAERRRLETPDFITEDEAAVIVAKRGRKEPGRKEPGRMVPLEELLAEAGISRRRTRA
jgi:hypothetical protein